MLVVRNGDSEKMYFGVNDPTIASAVIDVATEEEYPINLLLAATYISRAEHSQCLTFCVLILAMFPE